MARISTKYKNIYQDTKTGKYSIKYNFKYYDTETQKNKYASKCKYGFDTIAEAKKELAKLQAEEAPEKKDQEITLQGAFELWKQKAAINNYSPVSIENTKQHINMIAQFIPLTTKIKNIDDVIYAEFATKARAHGYSEETLHSINATFRKLINLCYKKRLIKENPLDFIDNMRTMRNNEHKLITHDQYLELDHYFKNYVFVRLGKNNGPKYRLLVSLLYYTGARIGEITALLYSDFEEFSYYSKKDNPAPKIAPSSKKEEHLRGWRIKITKSYLTDFKITKAHPKNFKPRTVPLHADTTRLFMRLKEEHLLNGGSLNDRVFPFTHGAVNAMIKKACEDLDLEVYSCHDFRHTNISNLIKKNVPLPVIEKVSGDTQATILKTYSNMFETDEILILEALKNL